VQPLWEKIWKLLKNLNIDPTPGDITKGMQLRLLQRHLNTHVYCSATIAKLWKHPRCPTTDEWIKKMWYLYTMEFYSAIKKNEILSFTSKWTELENIIVREVSQAQKAKYSIFSLICRFRPKTNAVILLDMGHMLRREHIREEWG
jgi:hypothetical protein